MDEQCVNGHVRTEENTKWHKSGRGGTLKRVCSDCRKQRDKVKVTTTQPAAHEIAKKRTTELHEDIEDLIRFGATFTEIIERGGFSTWASLRASLKRRGRDDLLEAMQKKIAASPNVKLTKPSERSPICGLRGCGRKRYHGKRCRKHYHQEWLGYGTAKPCTIKGCGGDSRARGYCVKHYSRYKRGTLDTYIGD